MLVLSRKPQEEIVIDLTNTDTLATLLAMPPADRLLRVIVTEIRGDKARLAVEAPKCVPLHRREVFDAIKRIGGGDVGGQGGQDHRGPQNKAA